MGMYVCLMSYVKFFHRTWRCHVRFLQPGFSQHRALGVRGQGVALRCDLRRRSEAKTCGGYMDFTVISRDRERERGLSSGNG